MVKCPACGTSINSDFGMTSCPQCSAVFMVEMDGTIHLPSDEAPIEEGPFEESPGEVSYSTPALDSEEAEAAYFEENPEEQIDTNTNQIVEQPLEESLEEGTVMYTPDPDSPLDAHNEVSGIVDASEMTFDGASEGSSEEEPPQEDGGNYSEDFMDSMNAEPKPIDPKDPLGVTAFDQAESSQLSEGLYYYDVRISGLDSAELRESVIDALSDPRFDWLPEDIKRSITGGQLILRSLNPIKTVLAVIKMQSLDVEVEWNQKLYTDESVNSGSEAES